jgi:DNA-binding response OmpR family regulator
MKPTLLIAERDPEFAELLQSFLTDRGYAVEAASDGLDCVAKLRRATPDAMVLDLELLWGGADGVLSWMREERNAWGLPVILTATAGADPNAVDDIELPVVKFLPKPFPLATLLEIVRSAVDGQKKPDLPAWQRSIGRSEMYIG